MAELDNWKVGIRNLAACLEKFNLEKYNNDIKRQSRKFIARLEDLFEGILEDGDEYDFSIIKVSVSTESKMLDLDRNKIFMLLMEFCSQIAERGDKLNGHGMKPLQLSQSVLESDDKHGAVKQANKKGIVLTGTVVNGFLEGQGKEEWPNGDVYIGDFVLGKKHGTGHFKFYDGSEYEGEFKDNSINGHGVYTWNDGRWYEGNFKNNKMDGFGKYTWPQGEVYEGEYKNDKRHGKGKFKWPDGREYDGYFEDGKKHGEAVYTDKNRVKKKGIWKDGKLEKWLN